MKTIENNSSSNTAIARDVNTLERLCAFKGENLVKLGDVTMEEAIRLSVSLVNRGEETKARGIFVAAAKLREMPDDAQRKGFRDALKSEIVLEAKERALALLPPDASNKLREATKAQAVAEAEKRFDNIGQTMRAACWMMDNPKKVADGVSVFTVQQALGPITKDGHPAKAEVLKLLAKMGTPQGAIKAAIKAAREAAAAAAVVPDNRTEAQKKVDAQTATIARLAERILLSIKDIDGLVAEGVKIEDIRSAKLAEAVRSLAKLAGLEVK